MKTTNRVFLALSLLYTIVFLILIFNWYGLTSSISKSAKYLTQENKDILFYAFICLNVFSFAWVGRSWLTNFGAMMLFGIGIATGYNGNLEPTNIQNIAHIILTNGAIVFVMLEIMLRKKQLGYILVSAFAIFTLISVLSKYPHHTYWIEVFGFAVAYVFYFVNPVNKKS